MYNTVLCTQCSRYIRSGLRIVHRHDISVHCTVEQLMYKKDVHHPHPDKGIFDAFICVNMMACLMGLNANMLKLKVTRLGHRAVKLCKSPSL